VVTDESGNQPVECEFIWAWIPSKRPAKTAAPSAADISKETLQDNPTARA
jgi:hypothetical protein